MFTCLCVGSASYFKTTSHGGIHYNVNPKQEKTQIERALDQLDINIIMPNPPQTQPRIEEFLDARE